MEWPAGTTAEADAIIWCTGFRPASATLIGVGRPARDAARSIAGTRSGGGRTRP